ncbi:MAG: hypothetical protein HKN78_06320 [Sphingomonadaceae bacterium]|nr:hypothetical protein [Sphingomonadaceae bacterium]
MSYLIQNFWLVMLASSLLGFLIGWWIWHRAAENQDAALAERSSAPIIPPAPVESEPIVATPEPEPQPVALAADSKEALELDQPIDDAEETATDDDVSPFLAAPDGDPDDLTKIKGVGPKLNDLLHGLGVYHFGQIAGWNDAQIEEVDSQLGSFKGRIVRDRWIDQARYLAAGDFAGFEHEFGRINGHR